MAAARPAAARPRSGREPAALTGRSEVPHMTELRNTEHELARFRLRLVAAALFVLFCFALLGARLAWLQMSWKR